MKLEREANSYWLFLWKKTKHLQAIEKDNILGEGTFGTGVKGEIKAKMFVSNSFMRKV